MTLTRRSFATLVAGGVATPLSLRVARAQAWPAKPVRAIVPFTAGSASDVIPRLIFDALSQKLGQPIIIDNRPGAGGTIGTAAVARSDPDGYTLLATASAHTINPTLYPDASYDAVRDFEAIIPLGSLPQVLVVSPASGFKSLKELVAAAKSRKGGVSYASAGVGSGSHFASERLRLSANFEGVHVPFKGGPEAITETMAGRVDFFFCPLALGIALIRDGRLKPLAVSAPVRATALPDTPTTLEEGFVDSDFTFWVGIFAPAKTPPAIVNELHGAIVDVLNMPDIKAKLDKLGVDPMPMTPGAFSELVKKEVVADAVVIKAAKMRGE
jgi:tripartite-type tricarboxylate transporter receptor subunit TctC